MSSPKPDPYQTPYTPNPNQSGPTLYPHLQPTSSQPIPASASINTADKPADNKPRTASVPPSYIESNPQQPLLVNQAQTHVHHYYHYPAYHPKHHYYRAKQSRCYGCCLGTCCACYCLCMCVGLIIGLVIAAFAANCMNRNVNDPKTFHADVNGIDTISIISNTGFTIAHGSVTFVSTNTHNVTIEVVRSTTNQKYLQDFDENFSVANNTISFTESTHSGEWFYEFEGCKSVEITVHVPTSFHGTIIVQTKNNDVSLSQLAGLSSVQATTTNSKIDVSGLTNIGTLTLSSSNDKISLATSNGNTATLSTTNSPIELSNLNFNSLNGQTTNSGIDVGHSEFSTLVLSTTNSKIQSSSMVSVNSTFTASTTNDGISFSNLVATSSSQIQLQTTNGRIDTTVNGFAGSFTAKSSNSNVSVSGPKVHISNNSKNNKSGTVGTGSGQFSASSSNGKITLAFN